MKARDLLNYLQEHPDYEVIIHVPSVGREYDAFNVAVDRSGYIYIEP